jgi:hypothetical protein
MRAEIIAEGEYRALAVTGGKWGSSDLRTPLQIEPKPAASDTWVWRRSAIVMSLHPDHGFSNFQQFRKLPDQIPRNKP